MPGTVGNWRYPQTRLSAFLKLDEFIFLSVSFNFLIDEMTMSLSEVQRTHTTKECFTVPELSKLRYATCHKTRPTTCVTHSEGLNKHSVIEHNIRRLPRCHIIALSFSVTNPLSEASSYYVTYMV